VESAPIDHIHHHDQHKLLSLDPNERTVGSVAQRVLPWIEGAMEPEDDEDAAGCVAVDPRRQR
jgi:hypothetical protein